MSKARLILTLAVVFSLFACAGVCIHFLNPDQPPFEARVYIGKDKVPLPYRLYVPSKYDPKTKYPLVIWLHGSDAIGNDNLKQITGYNTAGTQVWTTPKNRDSFPAIVLAPQSYERYWSFPGLKEPIREEQLVFETVAALQKEFSIDPDRIYLVGQSMGGFGTWAYLGNRPDFFAAGVVLCGPAVPTVVPRIAHIPVWVFHGAKDDNVPVANARGMVESLRKEGGQPRYTEFPNLGHEIGPATFAERDLLLWLFAQKRAAAHR
jgi:predicted peptidase